MKLELLENETPENIAKIWNAGHANKDCITAVIPSDVYDKLYKRSQEYPMVRRLTVVYTWIRQDTPTDVLTLLVCCTYAS